MLHPLYHLNSKSIHGRLVLCDFVHSSIRVFPDQRCSCPIFTCTFKAKVFDKLSSKVEMMASIRFVDNVLSNQSRVA